MAEGLTRLWQGPPCPPHGSQQENPARDALLAPCTVSAGSACVAAVPGMLPLPTAPALPPEHQ